VTEQIFTFANQLTLLRMLLIPAFVLLVVYGYFGWALITFIAAGATDLLDGLIARYGNQKTTLGAWLDPAADKLLLVTTFVWLTILIISRDVGIVLTVAIVNLALGPRTFRPSTLGKFATAFFIITCVVVMYFNYRGEQSWVVDVFIWSALVITLASAMDYVWRVARIINQ
jgi:cardiolipin synthase